MGDGYGIVYLVIYGGYLAILLLAVGIGILLLRKGLTAVGWALIAAVIAWSFGPPAYDRLVDWRERQAIDAANALPDTLSFEGQRVLVIEAGNTICAELCGDIVQLGLQGEFYWLGIGHYTGAVDVPNPDFAILNHGDEILRVVLGDPVEDMDGMRFAEPVEGATIPPFDVVLIDDNGYLRSYAPQLLALPEELVPRTQVARVLIKNWADPFTDPPPPSTYRSVAPWQDVGDFVFWPISRNDNAHPSLTRMRDGWSELLCAQAGPPEARDAFTYGFLCAPDSLDEVLGASG